MKLNQLILIIAEVNNIKPECKLLGTDGNVFAIMGKVRRTLKAAGMEAEAKEYTDKVTSCRSYDEALQITIDYVEVI